MVTNNKMKQICPALFAFSYFTCEMLYSAKITYLDLIPECQIVLKA